MPRSPQHGSLSVTQAEQIAAIRGMGRQSRRGCDSGRGPIGYETSSQQTPRAVIAPKPRQLKPEHGPGRTGGGLLMSVAIVLVPLALAALSAWQASRQEVDLDGRTVCHVQTRMS